jgi:Cu(I)/Ag(I) efflux system periplasmic protein CusF
MMTAWTRIASAGVLAFGAVTAFAQQPAAADHSAHHPAAAQAPAAPAASADLAEGEVRRIDKAAGKVTLRHGEIKSLDMPPMTMVFTVTDPALLENLRQGDKVKFRAVHEGGQYRVTALEPAN